MLPCISLNIFKLIVHIQQVHHNFFLSRLLINDTPFVITSQYAYFASRGYYGIQVDSHVNLRPLGIAVAQSCPDCTK